MNVQSTSRVENLADKKRAIYRSVLELIQDHGFHGTTMSLVARHANVAAGTIYHYFESKDQLICELYEFNRNRLTETTEEMIREESTYRENYFRVWEALYRFFTENTGILIFFEQYLNSPYNRNRDYSSYQGALHRFFENGSRQGELKPMKPEVGIILTMSSVSSAAKLNRFSGISLDEEDRRQIIQTLWDGFANH